MPDTKILQTRLKQDEKGTIQKPKNHGWQESKSVRQEEQLNLKNASMEGVFEEMLRIREFCALNYIIRLLTVIRHEITPRSAK